MDNVTDFFNSTIDLNFTDQNYTDETQSGAVLDRNAQIERLIPLYAVSEFGELYYVYFPIILVVCLVGIVTNALNIAVFTRPNMMNPVNFLLTALSVADILLMASQIPTTIHQAAGFKNLFEEGWWKFFIVLVFLEIWGMLLTNWLAVTVGLFRLIYTQFHLRSNTLCSMLRAKLILVAIAILSVIISGLAAGTLNVDAHLLPSGVLYAKGHSNFAKQNPSYLKAVWGIMLFCSLIPSLLLIVVTSLLIWSLIAYKRKRKQIFKKTNSTKKRERNERQDAKTTSMLVVLLVLFVLNNLPDASVNISAFYETNVSKSVKKATDVLRVFSMLNNAVSFFIYYFMSVNFRKTFNATFLTCLRKDSKAIKTASSETCSSTALPRNESSTGLPLYKLDAESCDKGEGRALD